MTHTAMQEDDDSGSPVAWGEKKRKGDCISSRPSLLSLP
jgi:hypothetical protein